MKKQDMLLSTDQGIMNSDEIAVYTVCRTFIHYVMHMKANVYEYTIVGKNEVFYVGASKRILQKS